MVGLLEIKLRAGQGRDPSRNDRFKRRSVRPYYKLSTWAGGGWVLALSVVLACADPVAETASLPKESIAAIQLLDPSRLPLQPHATEGTVTLQDPDLGFFIQDGSGGLHVHLREPRAVKPGERVGIAGFPFRGFHFFALTNGVMESLPAGSPVTALRLDADKIPDGRHWSTLVSAEGLVLDCITNSTNTTLFLEFRSIFFKADLPMPLTEKWIEILQRGRPVRITGVCLPLHDSQGPMRRAFLIKARGMEDITLLARPRYPWVRDAAPVLALLGLASALIALWAITLRFQVRRQTRLLRSKLEYETALEEQFRNIFDSANDLIYIHDLEGRFTNVNKTALDLTGYTREESLEMTVGHIVAPECRLGALECMERHKAGEILAAYTCDVLTKAGQRLHLEVNSRLLLEGGKPVGVLGIARDITARLQAEESLRLSEEKYRAIVNASMDGIMIQDIETNVILDANRRLIEMYGTTLEKLRTSELADFSALLPPYTLEAAQEYKRKAIEEGPQFFEWLAKDFSERHFWVEINLQCISINRQDRLVAIVRDISQRRLLEEELRQSQKMEAVGQLAGGVAHDFNNLLTVIKGHVSLLLDDTHDLPQLHDSLREVDGAADRAANLTRQLLAFSRRQVLQIKKLDLNEILGNITRMLKRLIGEHITLEFNYGAGLPPIEADAGMVEQIVINLAVNARDAMPQGGKLIMRTEAVELTREQARHSREARPGHYVCLTVLDNGVGMNGEVLNRLFEPFFTTKEQGKGTGLGLATVYGIVKQHRGWIDVSSLVGGGTTFKVWFPVDAHGACKAATMASRPAPLRGGTETILVVEDELPVRQLAVRCLEHYGYHVLQAGSGQEALALWHKQRDVIDVLLTDIVMPEGISGCELASRCLADKPGLKVIYSSGYSPDVVSGKLKLVDGVNFLPKPYAPVRLVEVVRRCLDREPAASAGKVRETSAVR